MSVTDLMALGKLRPTSNQDEGHDAPKQVGATSQSSCSRKFIHKVEACKRSSREINHDQTQVSDQLQSNEQYDDCFQDSSLCPILFRVCYQSKVFGDQKDIDSSFVTSNISTCMSRVKENERARETRGVRLLHGPSSSDVNRLPASFIILFFLIVEHRC